MSDSDLIVELQDTSKFDEIMSKSTLPVGILFYEESSTEFVCDIKKLNEETKNFKLILINVEADYKLNLIAEKYEVIGFPNIKFFKGGSVVDEVIGWNIEAIREIVEKI